MPLLAIAFASVIAAIAALDRPIGGFAVTQQPLIDLLSSMQTTSGRESSWNPMKGTAEGWSKTILGRLTPPPPCPCRNSNTNIVMLQAVEGTGLASMLPRV